MLAFLQIRNVLIVVQILIGINIVSAPLPKRKCYPWSVFVTNFAMILIFLFLPTGKSITDNATYQKIINIFYYIIICICSYIVLMINHKAPVSSLLLCVVTGYTIQHISYVIMAMHFQALKDIFKDNLPAFLAQRYYHRPYFFPFIVILSNYCRKLVEKRKEIALPNTMTIFISLFFLLANIVVTSFPTPSLAEGQYDFYFWQVSIFNLLCCIALLLMLFVFEDKFAEAKENEIIRKMQAEQEKQYQMTKEAIELINIKCHDIKHQLNQRNTFQSEEELREAIKIYDTDIKTGRNALDTVIQEKYLLCQGNNIKFEVMAEGKCLDCLDDSDVYSLFGNLLDNAVDAIKEIEDPDMRIVTLNIKNQSGLNIIKVSNPYSGTIQLKNDLPQTTKGSEDYHGFGLKSVQNIVSRHEGTMKISTEYNTFTITITFFPE